ncbi:hypothetical protein FRC09_008705 [Ceratobasidium sp. 395]|nr:hypothetical protein FRC09_008705 [Ceratobasidium sp. 395]
MPVAAFTHSSDRPQNYVAVWRRPPHTTRRTATTVLAGNHGWLEFDDILALRTNKPALDPSTSASATSQPILPPLSQPLLRDTNDDNAAPASAAPPSSTTTSRRNTITATTAPSTVPAKGGRGKGKAKPPPASRPVDMGVSIIPICTPGTGTPSPEPEPPSPPPHPHPRRPPLSSASTSSGVSSSIAGGPDFDAGAQRAAGSRAAGVTVGKRSRGPSQSQHNPQFPISPPVTSPNTSTSELPPASALTCVPPLPPPTNRTKRAREGREAQRRKRRKTETRGQAPPLAVAHPQGEHVDDAVRKQAPSRAPARRKGWKGWIMVSDTEGSDAERAATPPVVVLQKKTRSGRDFDQDLPPRVNRRGRSTVSVGTESVTTNAAPLSSATAT